MRKGPVRYRGSTVATENIIFRYQPDNRQSNKPSYHIPDSEMNFSKCSKFLRIVCGVILLVPCTLHFILEREMYLKATYKAWVVLVWMFMTLDVQSGYSQTCENKGPTTEFCEVLIDQYHHLCYDDILSQVCVDCRF